MRPMRAKLMIIVLAAILLGTTGTPAVPISAREKKARAALVTYYFAGTMHDPFGTIPVGMPFTGSFTYDAAQPINTPSIPYRGDYTCTNLTVTFGSVTLTYNGTGQIYVFDNPYPTDLFLLYPPNPSGSLGGLSISGMVLALQDETRTVFSSPAILPPNLTLSNFTSGQATFLELESFDGQTFIFARGWLTSLSNTPMTAPCIPPPPGMFAWYRFDEPSTVLAAAETIHWNNGIYKPLAGSGLAAITGEVGNGLRFDGIDDYVESPHQTWLNVGAGDLSVDSWIRVSPIASSATHMIIDKRSGSPPTMTGYSFFASPGQLGIQLADAGATPGYSEFLSPTFTPSLADGDWHHVAVTVRRTASPSITWYHNGAVIGQSNPAARKHDN